jgi:hypothetical protein
MDKHKEVVANLRFGLAFLSVDGRRRGNGKDVGSFDLPNKKHNPCTSIETRKSSLISETIRNQ